MDKVTHTLTVVTERRELDRTEARTGIDLSDGPIGKFSSRMLVKSLRAGYDLQLALKQNQNPKR